MEGSKEDNSFEKLSVDSDYINQVIYIYIYI